jgi:hypothetical protein
VGEGEEEMATAVSGSEEARGRGSGPGRLGRGAGKPDARPAGASAWAKWRRRVQRREKSCGAGVSPRVGERGREVARQLMGRWLGRNGLCG